ncbi:hypothetical protein QFZ30_003900 [Arthrobacter pascens]|nr:hypothetical protein [Arthrobacter pascens]
MLQRNRVSMWASLQRGDAVTLSQRGVECHKGFVDERTEDGQTIWVIDKIGDRRLFHIEDDCDLQVSENVHAS